MDPPTTCSSCSSQALLDHTVVTTASTKSKSPQQNAKIDGSSPNNKIKRFSPQLRLKLKHTTGDVKPNYQTSQQQQQKQHLANDNHHYKSRNATKIIKGEIHNVCLTMRSDPRYYINISTASNNNSSSDGGYTAAMMRRSRFEYEDCHLNYFNSNKNFNSLTNVDEILKIVSAIKKKKNKKKEYKIYNFGSNRPMKIGNILKILKFNFNSKSKLKELKVPKHSSMIDNSHIENDLSIKMKSTYEILDYYIKKNS